jgi:SAM-dependent methyltransferase
MDNPVVSADATRSADATGSLADPELARRASSFGAAAAAYAEHRPGYPRAAIEWALEPVISRRRSPAGGSGPSGSSTADPIRILDLGAGTGKLTAQLAALEFAGQPISVVAVEPDPKMLAEFRAQLPGLTVMAGRAESIPLPDASVDAVLAGQAAHWFDLDRAMPEMARVLAPGGVLAGLWNAEDDRVDWVAGLHVASSRKPISSFTAFAERAAEEGPSAWLAAGREFFSPPEDAQFEHSYIRTADSLIETMRTHSMFLVMEPAEREAVLARVRAYLATTPRTAAGEFSVPICTFALRTVRS